MITELLSGLLIVCLALGAVCVLIVQVTATIKAAPDRRRFRADMRERKRLRAEREAREREAGEP